MSSLGAADTEAGKHAVAPRVTLADMENAIAYRFDLSPVNLRSALVSSMLNGPAPKPSPPAEVLQALSCFTVCILVMTNGFTIVGNSAPASPANYDAELGQKLAYEDCIRQLWPLMGFSLRDRLAAA